MTTFSDHRFESKSMEVPAYLKAIYNDHGVPAISHIQINDKKQPKGKKYI